MQINMSCVGVEHAHNISEKLTMPGEIIWKKMIHQIRWRKNLKDNDLVSEFDLGPHVSHADVLQEKQEGCMPLSRPIDGLTTMHTEFKSGSC